MSFWSWMNNTPTPASHPGDPHGAVLTGEAVAARALPTVWPSAWDGWPAEWATPSFYSQSGLSNLIDVAWAAIDLNSSVLASMPVYRLRNGEIIPPLEWMVNPDPTVYASWFEFAKELFWSYQLGEAFVLSMSSYADGWPQQLRVIPPWLVTVELRNGSRQYFLGGVGGHDVTGDILHIRYQSSIDDAHGHGPLECAGARMTAAGLLQRYAQRLAETGGTPHYWLGVERRLNQTEANDLLAQWVESRTANAGYPALLSGGATLNQLQSMSAKDMALLELSQWNESRIAVALGVPPFLMGLPSGGDSLCVDTDTEILTRDGWKRYNELAVGSDDVLTLNHETGVSEWQPLLDVSVFDVVDRNMVRMEMQGHSSFSTDDHQWPVVFTSEKTGRTERILRLSRDIKRTDALVTAAPCADQPTEPKYSDAFVELVAWWYTEGWVGTWETAHLAQSEAKNPEHCARIRSALVNMFGSGATSYNQAPAFSEYTSSNPGMRTWRLNRSAAQSLWEVVDDRRRKVVKRDFLYRLTPAQLELFIQVSVWADGCESLGKNVTFKQYDTDRLERFELACLLAGRTTQRHGPYSLTVRRRGGMRPAEADRRARRVGREPLIEFVKWSGRVWCPTTPNETWFARRNGTMYFTHNTYSTVAQLFDFHDRSSIRPKATAVMSALSNWALPRGQTVELNRDEYSRPGLKERAEAWQILAGIGVVDAAMVRAAERIHGEPSTAALAGANTFNQQPTQPEAAASTQPQSQSAPAGEGNQ